MFQMRLVSSAATPCYIWNDAEAIAFRSRKMKEAERVLAACGGPLLLLPLSSLPLSRQYIYIAYSTRVHAQRCSRECNGVTSQHCNLVYRIYYAGSRTHAPTHVVVDFTRTLRSSNTRYLMFLSSKNKYIDIISHSWARLNCVDLASSVGKF